MKIETKKIVFNDCKIIESDFRYYLVVYLDGFVVTSEIDIETVNNIKAVVSSTLQNI